MRVLGLRLGVLTAGILLLGHRLLLLHWLACIAALGRHLIVVVGSGLLGVGWRSYASHGHAGLLVFHRGAVGRGRCCGTGPSRFEDPKDVRNYEYSEENPRIWLDALMG